MVDRIAAHHDRIPKLLQHRVSYPSLASLSPARAGRPPSANRPPNKPSMSASSCNPSAPVSTCTLTATPTGRTSVPPWWPPPPLSLKTVPPTGATADETPAPSRPRHSMLRRATGIHFHHPLPHLWMEWPHIHQAIHSRKVPFRMVDRRLAHVELRLARRRARPTPPPMTSPPTLPAKSPSSTAITSSYLPSAPPPSLADDVPVGHGSAARIPAPSSSPYIPLADNLTPGPDMRYDSAPQYPSQLAVDDNNSHLPLFCPSPPRHPVGHTSSLSPRQSAPLLRHC